MDSIKDKEAAIRKKWQDINLLSQLEDLRKDGEKYFLLDGPPYANYEPHVGHIRNTVYKDMYVRWNFMKGKQVLFQAGFDTHGLPIENMVEKKLNLKSKKDIQTIGIAKFMQTCHDSAALNKDLWLKVYDLLGSWYSWKEPYLTYDNSYIQSVWWSFKRVWEKGLAYEGKKPVFWCPSCETALAGYEATDSYKNVTDPAIYVLFKLKEKDASLLVYTTTPWTLPSNCAVMVAGDEDYVTVATNKGNVILAKERLELLDKLEIEYNIIETFKGKDLDGKEYESLLDVPSQKVLQANPKALRVYLSQPILKERVGSKVAAKKGLTSGDIYEDFVTVNEGTGLVHCAPGHGKSDNEMGKRYGLPEVSPLDDQCKFTDEVGEFQGIFVKDADHKIADKINEHGKLFHYSSIEHSYPLCWRCKSPLIFRMSNQWFLKIEPLKEKMLEANEHITWQPDFAKERFAAWLANAEDWNFSRQRYWGVPIPIWKTESGKTYVVGSEEEFRSLATKEVPADFDLHAVNSVELKHPESGEVMTRINDIFDVWYDSGAAPFASLGYPFKNKELFESFYPVSRVNESQDQIRGWFYSLLFCNMATFDKAPYKTVSMPGWVLDDKGDKMSKSVGNFIPAKETLEELGADAVRFYYCWDITPGSTQKFNLGTIRNDIRKFFSIWNNLITLTKNHNNNFSENITVDAMEDKWLLSRLHGTIKKIREAIESFELNLAGREAFQFIVEDLSRTYVQFVRERMEQEEVPSELIGLCLWQISKLLAAITPHQSEFCYQELAPLCDDEVLASVHLTSIPKPDLSLIHENVEADLVVAGEVIAGILAARDRMGVGVRWPLEKVVVDVEEDVQKSVLASQELILRQTNLKSLVVESFPVSFDAKPNFRSLGKSFGEKTGDAITVLQKNKDVIIAAVTGEQKKIVIDDFEFIEEYLNLEKIVPDSHVVGECKKGSVYVQVAVSRALELEGFSREVTRRIQQLRKDAGLQKHDRITCVVVSALADELQSFVADMRAKVGADSLTIVKVSDTSLAHESSCVIKKESFQVMLESIA